MKIFLTTVALAALAASPAFAASHRHVTQNEMAPNGYSAYAAVPGQDVVAVDGQIAGRDPDANVRLQLLRDANGYAY